MDDPQAPDTGGQTVVVASELRPDSGLAPATDEELRRLAVMRLSEHLEVGATLVGRCEQLAMAHRGDRLGPLYAAARLMRANALVAQALAHVAQVEYRQRSIVERIQPPDPKLAELNSRLQREEGGSEVKLKFWRRVDELVEQSIRARSGETQEDDRVADLVKHEEEELVRIKNERAEVGAS